MVLFLLLLMTHLPKVEASPKEKRDHGKRQTHSKIYLYWIKVGISFGHPA